MDAQSTQTEENTMTTTQRIEHIKSILTIAMTKEALAAATFQETDNSVQVTVNIERAKCDLLHNAYVMNHGSATGELCRVLASWGGYFHVTCDGTNVVIGVCVGKEV
jgi:hypothetical protein